MSGEQEVSSFFSQPCSAIASVVMCKENFRKCYWSNHGLNTSKFCYQISSLILFCCIDLNLTSFLRFQMMYTGSLSTTFAHGKIRNLQSSPRSQTQPTVCQMVESFIKHYKLSLPFRWYLQKQRHRYYTMGGYLSP